MSFTASFRGYERVGHSGRRTSRRVDELDGNGPGSAESGSEPVPGAAGADAGGEGCAAG
jgi:hypothetical protein